MHPAKKITENNRPNIKQSKIHFIISRKPIIGMLNTIYNKL